MNNTHGGPRARNRRQIAGIGPALALGLVGACGSAHAAYTCADLAAVTTADSTVTSAASVAAGTNVNGSVVPVAMCRVQGVARPSSDSEIKWEVWLPDTAAAWTGRMKVNGTGGYAGATPYPRLAQDVGDGFVSAGSNMGHDGGESATWTLGHPEKVKDWGLRAHYSVATAAKTLATVYFGKPVEHSYFEGCSNGGRQAMMMAQNYPELFDGIVAGAPSMFYPDLLFWLLWTGKQQIPVAGGPPVLTDAKRAQVTQRVLAACDSLDGLADGQITNPRACRFDVDTLGPAGDKTLTAAELAVVKSMYGGTRTDAGVQRSPGAKLGSEADWVPLFADNGGYGAFIEHYVYSRNTPSFDWRRQLDFSGVYDEAKKALTPVTAAPSPDISAFVGRGGKLIHYHGWNDAVVPPDGSIAYLYALAQFEKLRGLSPAEFDRAVDALAPADVAATGEANFDKVRQYHRLFMLPTMAHCTQASTGPTAIGGGAPEPPASLRDSDHHVVSAMIKWVEQGVAPERIIATKMGADGKVARQRPVCAYPAEAKYKGSGNVDDAASFTCVTPAAADRVMTATDLMVVQSSLRQRNLKLPNR